MTTLLEYAEELAASDHQLAQHRRLADVDTRTIDDRFHAFHTANPQVFRELVNLAQQAVDRGKKRIGMKMLFEVLRWNTWLATEGDPFKLNNDFTSRYSRLLIQTHPEWEGLFQMRELHS